MCDGKAAKVVQVRLAPKWHMSCRRGVHAGRRARKSTAPTDREVINAQTPRRWQRGGNTPPCTNCKELAGETAEIGLSWALSGMDRNPPQTPRRPRNEGVRGSSPRVGFKKLQLSRRCSHLIDSSGAVTSYP